MRLGCAASIFDSPVAHVRVRTPFWGLLPSSFVAIAASLLPDPLLLQGGLLFCFAYRLAVLLCLPHLHSVPGSNALASFPFDCPCLVPFHRSLALRPLGPHFSSLLMASLGIGRPCPPAGLGLLWSLHLAPLTLVLLLHWVFLLVSGFGISPYVFHPLCCTLVSWHLALSLCFACSWFLCLIIA